MMMAMQQRQRFVPRDVVVPEPAFALQARYATPTMMSVAVTIAAI